MGPVVGPMDLAFPYELALGPYGRAGPGGFPGTGWGPYGVPTGSLWFYHFLMN